MKDFTQSRVIVILFVIQGCEACDDFKPRFHQIAQRYRQYIPIMMMDANDPRCADLAGRLNVGNVPATFVLRRPTGAIRVEGAIPNSQIAWLLDIAAREAANPNY